MEAKYHINKQNVKNSIIILLNAKKDWNCLKLLILNRSITSCSMNHLFLPTFGWWARRKLKPLRTLIESSPKT